MGGSAGAADRRFVFYILTADANAKLLAKTVTIRENREETEKRIEEVMENNYESYQWGMFYTKSNKEYCVIVRGDEEINFGKILSTM